ncbi:hypothetical protein ACKWTF_003555 [Chironomus riparius]
MAHMRRSKKKDRDSVLIDAEFRIKAEKMIEKFFHSNETVFQFPSILTNVERAFVHNLAPKYSLKTKSHGFGSERKLSLFKLVEDENFVHKSANMALRPEVKTLINDYLNTYQMPSEVASPVEAKVDINNFQPFALTCSPIIPPKLNQPDSRILQIRKNLSIHEYKDRIMQTIDKNRIILIQGSTGSGKTTQIPQYIMETASYRNEPCRILCTQPRRISAIASAERVCYERGVTLGTSIGYQIRLDSQISANTNCIFLTPGVFLRYLMGKMPERLFKNVTHILIDEAHERAKENDFLLTSIKEHFHANPNMKLIIMSATMDTAVFHNYFGKSEEISILTKQFNVEEYYLEDVLKMVNFTNPKVQELNEKYRSGQLIQASTSAFINESMNENADLDADSFDDDLKAYIDELLNNMGTHDNPENYFDEFLYLVMNEGVPVNYRHSQTNMTALMIAIGRQWVEMIEKLLKINADPKLKVDVCGYEMNCIDFAEKICGAESRILHVLKSIENGPKSNSLSNDEVYNKALLNIYQDSVLKTKQNNFVVEETIDHILIVQLVQKIHISTEKNGAILIFLPGFDDILQLSRLINETITHDFTLFMLHSSMKTDDQKNVFKPTAQGRRKIILSTNIAESSITIDDVVYVIDVGREKQKSYDCISHSSSLRVQWISKASANQRRGRAGRLRDGIVYRIYSRDRFTSMLDVTIPELLRTSLTEVCLQSKLLVEDNKKIEEFLQSCIAAPSIANVRQSIKYLQKMGALNKEENLTHLGSHLVGMPLEAKYGKMIIYAIIFKCVNPILSLTSILTMGDQVFVLPINPADRYKCEKWKRSVAYDSYSDHFLMIKIFNHFLHLKNTRQNEKRFCEEHFISSYHVEQVRGIRNQILNYLHSSGLLKDNSHDMNKNSNNWPLIKSVVAAGLYPFIARVERKKGQMYTEIDNKLTFHMSSIMYVKKEGFRQTIKNIPYDWTVFEEKNRVGRVSMLKCNTLLSNLPMCLMAGLDLKEDKKEIVENDDDDWEDDDDDSDDEPNNFDDFSTLKVDNFLKFFISQRDSSSVLAFRQRLNHLITRFLSEKHFKHSRVENDLVDVVANILANEDSRTASMDLNIIENIEIPSSFNAQNRNQNNRGYDNRKSNSSRSGNYQRNQQQNWQQGHSQNSMQSNPQPERNQSYNDQQNSRPYAREDKRGGFTPNDRNQPSNSRSNQNQSWNMKRNNTSQRLKYFILKMNNQKLLGNMTANTVINIDDLKLKVWQFHKIRSLTQSGNLIHLILYSTSTKHFLGYGTVSKVDENRPLMFHFRCSHYLPLGGLGSTKFAQDIAHPLSQQSFQFHELDSTAGSSLIHFFESD